MRQFRSWSKRTICCVALIALAALFVVNSNSSGAEGKGEFWTLPAGEGLSGRSSTSTSSRGSIVAKQGHSAAASPPPTPPAAPAPDNIDDDARRAVRPLWRCNESQTKRRSGVAKLGFVHVFKAAGSTLSGLFEGYATKCHAGYGRLVQCNSIESESIRRSSSTGENWRNCTLKKVYRRNGDYVFTDYKGKVNNTFLGRHLDIIGGHQRLGSLDYLTDGAGNRTGDLRYVTFVRDAAAKFVSGVVFGMAKKRGTTPRDIMKKIYEHVERQVARGQYHDKYATYLLTPTQAEEWKQRKHDTGEESMEKANAMIMKNLVDYNVMVGVVERMAESMEMLQHLIDPDGDATGVFVEYGMAPPNGFKGREEGGRRDKKKGDAAATGRRHNESPLSASVVLRFLRKNEQFAKKLEEYVKYEQQITDFATEMHLKQYSAMRMSKMSMA